MPWCSVHPPDSDLIYNRSVHNCRIERLWLDYTQGIGGKWREFFWALEEGSGLDADNPAHIWLLQYLFLDAINEDVQEWAEAWNAHKIQVPEGGSRSPRDMYIFGMIEHGPRGIEHMLDGDDDEEEDIGNPEEYGVDWEAQRDPRILNHLLDNNPQEDDGNPLLPRTAPTPLSHIEVVPPPSPLTDAKMDLFEEHFPDVPSRSMEVRKLLWEQALAYCLQLNPEGAYCPN